MSELDTALLHTYEKAIGINCFVVDVEAPDEIPGGGYAFCNECYSKQKAEFGRAKCEEPSRQGDGRRHLQRVGHASRDELSGSHHNV